MIDHMKGHWVKRGAMLLACAIVAAGCSESSLATLGGRSSDWIGEPGNATVQTVPGGGIPIVRSVEVSWVNDSLGASAVTGEPADIVAAIVSRSEGPERYIQASRLEIAAALPGLGFPDLLPPEITAITSQLVVAPSRDRLDDEVFAAFGLWTVEPYTKSRSVGQRGTLVVSGLHTTSACERFAAGAVAACTSDTIGLFDATRIDAESGQTWVWDDGTYEYQLFLRGSLDTNSDVADFMVRNGVPFAVVADPTARVLGTSVTSTSDE